MDQPIGISHVLPRKRGERAEVGRTRLFPLALRGQGGFAYTDGILCPPLFAIEKEISIPGGIPDNENV